MSIPPNIKNREYTDKFAIDKTFNLKKVTKNRTCGQRHRKKHRTICNFKIPAIEYPVKRNKRNTRYHAHHQRGKKTIPACFDRAL